MPWWWLSAEASCMKGRMTRRVLVDRIYFLQRDSAPLLSWESRLLFSPWLPSARADDGWDVEMVSAEYGKGTEPSQSLPAPPVLCEGTTPPGQDPAGWERTDKERSGGPRLDSSCFPLPCHVQPTQNSCLPAVESRA